MQETGLIAFVFVACLVAVVCVIVYAEVQLQKERQRWQTEREQIAATHQAATEDLRTQMSQLRLDHQRELDAARRDSTDRSRSVLKGQAAEIMVPHLPGFQYVPADARFIGSPIDYIVFNGLSELDEHRTTTTPFEVILLEIKQGQSSISIHQQAVRRAIEDNRVRFEVLYVGEDGSASAKRRRVIAEIAPQYEATSLASGSVQPDSEA